MHGFYVHIKSVGQSFVLWTIYMLINVKFVLQ